MNFYKLYGFLIEADIEFDQLILADDADKTGNTAIITVKRNAIIYDVNKGLENEEQNYKIGFDISYLRNSWGYYLVKNGREIFYELKDDASIIDVKPFLLGYCMAMALLQNNILAVHCSAVCEPEGLDEGAILIAGESGAGKSTITRRLLEQGYRLMADDVAAVKMEDNAFVYSAFPYQKLCRNEIKKRNFCMEELIYIGEDKDKFLVPVKDAFVRSPQKLKFMVYMVITEKTEVQVQKLKGIAQLIAFKNNLFLHRLRGDWENDPGVLDLCLTIAADCPVYVISRPENKDTIDEILNNIQICNNYKLEN